MKNLHLLSAILLVGSAPALANPAQEAAAAASAAAPEATPAATFSDAELLGFANAAIAADKIQKDETIAAADKQTKILEAVQAQGLDPVRYNEIAQATRADPELVKKIQQLASAKAAATGNP
jgi:hypothetical protein